MSSEQRVEDAARASREPDRADAAGNGACVEACFDPALAQFPVRYLPLAEVIDLLHVTHAPDTIASYGAAMSRGQRFPPVAVVRVGGRFFVADGHKRLSAYKELVRAGGDARSDVLVQVWTWRRWLNDQGRQLRRKTRQQAALLSRSLTDPAAREEGRRLVADTVGHWRRAARSVASRWQGAPVLRRGAREAPTPVPMFRRLIRECVHFPGRLAVAIISLLAGAAAQLYLTWLVKLWTEGPVLGADGGGLRMLMRRGALTATVLVVAVFLSRYLLNSVNQMLVQRLRDAVQRRVLTLGVDAVRQAPTGEWLSRLLNDAQALSGFVRDTLKRFLGEGLVLVGAVAMMFHLEWRLALLTCTVVPLVAVLLGRVGRIIRRRSTLAHEALARLTATASEQLHGLSTIMGFQTEQVELERFSAQNARYRLALMRAEWWSAALMSLVWLVCGATLLAVIWSGSRQVVVGNLTAGGMVAFLLYAAQTIEPLRRLSEIHAVLQQTLAAATRVYEFIDAPAPRQDGTLALPIGAQGALRLDRVCFAYDAGETVLDELTLDIAPGETVALVAASGGGKTTLARLLVRFIEPQRGWVRLHDIDIRALRVHDLRAAVCVVEQEPFVFTGRLLDNLCYGSPGASRRMVEEAVALAGLDAFVGALPNGLATVIEESGRNLSVGQKQRIALARAVVRNPLVVVLDEATSALDSDTEGQIFARLEDWLHRRTALVMAHRLATISRFPRIIVLDGGTVVGDASVDDLIRGCAAFTRLFGEQILPLTRADQLCSGPPMRRNNRSY